jgi:hypothetical protein
MERYQHSLDTERRPAAAEALRRLDVDTRQQLACRRPPPSLSPHDSIQIYTKFRTTLPPLTIFSPPQARELLAAVAGLHGLGLAHTNLHPQVRKTPCRPRSWANSSLL